MDYRANTQDLNVAIKLSQDNNLLDIVKELCSDPDGKLSLKVKAKVNRIVADCDLKHYSSLHKVSTADESTSTLLGFMHQSPTELTFDEQAELNLAVIDKIEKKLPSCISELELLKKTKDNCFKLRQDKCKELQERDNKLDILQQQENEKMDLMMEWLNHRLGDVLKFSNNSTELLTLKTKIVDLKSKILHLQVLQTIFTETNQSIKAYSEVQTDLKDSIKETELRIKNFREIIESDCDF